MKDETGLYPNWICSSLKNWELIENCKFRKMISHESMENEILIGYKDCSNYGDYGNCGYIYSPYNIFINPLNSIINRRAKTLINGNHFIKLKLLEESDCPWEGCVIENS